MQKQSHSAWLPSHKLSLIAQKAVKWENFSDTMTVNPRRGRKNTKKRQNLTGGLFVDLRSEAHRFSLTSLRKRQLWEKKRKNHKTSEKKNKAETDNRGPGYRAARWGPLTPSLLRKGLKVSLRWCTDGKSGSSLWQAWHLFSLWSHGGFITRPPAMLCYRPQHRCQ